MRIRLQNVLILAALAAPASLEAQRSGSVELTPYIGYLLPADLVSGPLGTRVSVEGGPIFGGQLGLVVVPGVTLVGHVANSTADVSAGAPLLGGVAVGRSDSWMFDGSLQLSVPAGNARALRPFLQVGAGVLRREVSIWELTARSTSTAFNAGVGLDLSLAPGVGVRLLARDHIGRFDFQEAVLVDYDGGTTHNVTLGAGLRVSF